MIEHSGRASVVPPCVRAGCPMSDPDRGQREPGKLLVSVDEAASVLSIGRTTMWRLIRERRIEARKIDRRTLIPWTELAAFVYGLQHGDAALNRAPCCRETGETRRSASEEKEDRHHGARQEAGDEVR